MGKSVRLAGLKSVLRAVRESEGHRVNWPGMVMRGRWR